MQLLRLMAWAACAACTAVTGGLLCMPAQKLGWGCGHAEPERSRLLLSAGYKIPKGTGLRTAFYAMQRDEKLWERPVS